MSEKANEKEKVSGSGERSAAKAADATPKKPVAKEEPKEAPKAAKKEAPVEAPKEAPKAAPKEAPKAAPVPPAPVVAPAPVAPARFVPAWDKATWRAMAGLKLGVSPAVVAAALQPFPAQKKFTEAEIRTHIKAITEQRL